MNPENPPLILCSTARLARSLRLSHGRSQHQKGLVQWQPIVVVTLQQWLDSVIEQALLQGEIALDETPHLMLNSAQEIVLWEKVIERMLTGDAAALFDRQGLARAAMEANRLMQEWNIAVPRNEAYGHTEEVEQFLLWRAEFHKQCKASHWLEATRYVDWQIAQLQKGAGNFSAQLYTAGFDRISPQEQRLWDTLKARGVSVERWPHLLQTTPATLQIGLPDAEAECRAAVAWVAGRLLTQPAARLAIVVPELANLRDRLAALLDDVLHPAALSPALSETARSYDFSLGIALARYPLIASGLDLLRLAANRRNLSQQDFSRLLLGPYWSSSINEGDARAQLDAVMRADLPVNVTLERVLRYARRQQEHGLGITLLMDDLQALLGALPSLPSRQLPSAWSRDIEALLKTANWPGERSLSSHEYQANIAFGKSLASLADFDSLSGPVNFSQVVQQLSYICTEQVFQPESQDDPQVLVMGMLETVATPLDAMWVMGMNDHIWPPAARPSPLLPAAIQRAARAPNADGPVQTDFAAEIHKRLLRSAEEIMFSWAHKSGESELRVSPVINGISQSPHLPELARTLAESLAEDSQMPGIKQWLDDHIAPPVTEGEKIRGGAGLIRAQAVCPAWAYYRYRLGARRLDEPVDGLDAMERGNLVHAVLQSFWQGHDSQYLDAMDQAALHAAIAVAVDEGIARFSKKLEEPLSPNFLMLEKQRLQYLLNAWLDYEKQRPLFTVEDCEKQEEVNLAGMAIKLTLDRVDRLADGKLIVIDYKTGSNISHTSWAEQRICEPQLPIYTSLALSGEHIAAVCFAQVRADEQRFIGIAAEAETLPGIKALQEAQKLFPPETFPDWIALLDHWKNSIEAIAQELVSGEAAVVFQHESDLRDCEVKPLLRLPERYLQIETDRKNGRPHDTE